MSSPLLSRILGVERMNLGASVLPAVVVFLVALPLSLGVAMASGVPPAAGLWSAIIGGLVVGRLAGAPLQVSGPAAGLAVLVFEIVQENGLAALGIVVFGAGLIQVAAGLLRTGRWFRAVSPAVIRGMLGGIGLLILASQAHVLLGGAPTGSGLQDWLTLPGAVFDLFFGGSPWANAAIGLLAVGAIVGWDRFRPESLRSVPGALVGVGTATAIALVSGAGVARVVLPESLIGSVDWLYPSELFGLNTSIVIASVTLAAVASAEALLSATAVDRLHDGPRTDYDRELLAQGAGNLVAGIFGALPVTGVIVRSSANVAAGARDRLPGMAHAAMILVLVLAAPVVLELIPTASLAAVLIVTGWRLLDLPELANLYRIDRVEAAILVTTALAIVGTDLLTGVAIGFGLAAARTLFETVRLDLDLQLHHDRREAVLSLAGAATFLSIPDLAEALDAIPMEYDVHLEHTSLQHADHAIVDLLENWSKNREGDIAPLYEALDDLRRNVSSVAQ